MGDRKGKETQEERREETQTKRKGQRDGEGDMEEGRGERSRERLGEREWEKVEGSPRKQLESSLRTRVISMVRMMLMVGDQLVSPSADALRLASARISRPMVRPISTQSPRSKVAPSAGPFLTQKGPWSYKNLCPKRLDTPAFLLRPSSLARRAKMQEWPA